MKEILSVKNITKTYQSKNGEINALRWNKFYCKSRRIY